MASMRISPSINDDFDDQEVAAGGAASAGACEFDFDDDDDLGDVIEMLDRIKAQVIQHYS